MPTNLSIIHAPPEAQPTVDEEFDAVLVWDAKALALDIAMAASKLAKGHSGVRHQ